MVSQNACIPHECTWNGGQVGKKKPESGNIKCIWVTFHYVNAVMSKWFASVFSYGFYDLANFYGTFILVCNLSNWTFDRILYFISKVDCI